jgi:predicted RNA-binding protein
MAYYVDLFSPETYEVFSNSPRDISGFRARHEGLASRIQPGDKFICYLTKLSRWIGVLEIKSNYFKDSTPIFYPSDDPFIIRFKVKPIVWLPKEKGFPIKDERVWNSLTFTKDTEPNSSRWRGKLRNSLNQLDENDGKFLDHLLLSQAERGERFPVDEDEYNKFLNHTIHREDKIVIVSVPQNNDSESDAEESISIRADVRESIKVQALLARIGTEMGMKIWLPRSDRTAVLTEWNDGPKPVLERLPLNYDETTLRTIEQIDVLWLRGRAIIRAFEVEHTTSIYSGILRMADLLALQPNMDIKLHIVAPDSRRDKVFQELRRPVFSLLDKGPLSESCTYLSYDSIKELSKERHLSHLSDSVLDEYAEPAE